MLGKHADRTLASAGGFLETVDPKWRGIVALFTVAVIAYGAGVWTSDEVASYESLEPRVESLEDWQQQHIDSVTTPGLRRLSRLEGQQTTISDQVDRIEAMVYRLFCADYPADCDGVPR